jgi:hypothetical protein
MTFMRALLLLLLPAVLVTADTLFEVNNQTMSVQGGTFTLVPQEASMNPSDSNQLDMSGPSWTNGSFCFASNKVNAQLLLKPLSTVSQGDRLRFDVAAVLLGGDGVVFLWDGTFALHFWRTQGTLRLLSPKNATFRPLHDNNERLLLSSSPGVLGPVEVRVSVSYQSQVPASHSGLASVKFANGTERSVMFNTADFPAPTTRIADLYQVMGQWHSGVCITQLHLSKIVPSSTTTTNLQMPSSQTRTPSSTASTRRPETTTNLQVPAQTQTPSSAASTRRPETSTNLQVPSQAPTELSSSSEASSQAEAQTAPLSPQTSPAVIGGAIGGVLFLLLLIGAVVFVVCRKRKPAPKAAVAGAAVAAPQHEYADVSEVRAQGVRSEYGKLPAKAAAHYDAPEAPFTF